ncbi:hypothetical protein BJI69_05290 [Luteibacter rhizovicinus DSM 16549]|uniref:Uncharacterized protein n=1 Tax=Luteibacter rhizovicinus DSM 16549 TaxID=1440763 RepID=A0A0G9HC85_9GAMM|nr:type II toxin-antitoxin system PemK/MazF family toxin [Luteibacter rhizovicinus]APG03384.1 hypothetical protein BJI69_05290 [Luteibacter rhizovicinus DSM 16549]KLD65292.1 hypothetical protein Y883_16805 [Luteibacter rhizovicinus DSM 16549]KLD80049.1 hypothetical protein Y886_01175 [Xanthomonas hyacinthi DSM 19077]
MVKVRPAIVVGRTLEGRRGLVNIVPISMTAPARRRLWHVPISVAAMPPGWREKPGDRWAKCDMLTVVSLERLSLTASARRSGYRRFGQDQVDGRTMRDIRRAIAYMFELF